MTVKGKRIEKSKLVKGPTEKDLIGLTCFTPDCDAIIVKIEIFEDNGKVTTIPDMKNIEKLEVDERKLKEESWLKKKMKNGNHKERFKNFEKKPMKESYLKRSNKAEKEKSKYSNKGEKEKSENNEMKINSTVLEKDDRHFKFTSHEIVVGKKVLQEESSSQEHILGVNNKKLGTRLNPSAPAFVPVNTEELLSKEKIFPSVVTIQETKQETVTKNAASVITELKKTCDESRTKLLHNEFKNYSEILAQIRANNQRVITHLIGSSELNHFPQVQITLNTLNEFSARLFQAEEELKSKYENLMRQSRDNKVIQELEFDLSSDEPPNLGPAYLHFLHSFIVMDQSSSLPTSSPSISQSSSTWKDSFATATSRFTSSPANFSAPDSSRINVDHHKNLSPGSNVQYPSNGATATYLNPSGPTLVSKNSASTCSARPNHKTGKQHDDLVSRVHTDHPSLSREQAHNYVMELRASHNGTLSGMVRKDILNKVASFIRRDLSNVGGASDVEKNGSIVDGANVEHYNCSICCEAMIASDSLYLNPCRHRFHTDCINPWLEAPGGAGSTCPMCRNYVVKEEEYPNLSRGDRRF